MSSRGKKKTTMAKLSRESRLRERRLDKQAKKAARRAAPSIDPALSIDPTLSIDPAPSGETPPEPER